MSDNKRYYWLKLSEDFFQEDTIKWIEEQENGVAYAYFYLKLCVKSLTDDGSLIRYVGDKLLPYDIKALSRLTDTDTDTVRVAMKLFEEIGLVETLATGEIYMSQINEMIGSETDSARRMRKKRARDNLIEPEKIEVLENSNTKNRHFVQNCDGDVQKSDTEYRDKSIEYRDKSLEVEVEGEEKTSTPTLHERIIDSWNSLGLQGLRTISNQRKTLLGARLKEFGEESIFEAIEKIRDSDFLKGQNRRGWVITFDWLIKPNNYVKVLEGNYNDEEKQTSPKKKPKGQNFERREIKDDEISRKIQEDLLREYMEATGKL